MKINPLTGQRLSDNRPVDKGKSTRASSFIDLLADQLLPPEEAQALTPTEAPLSETRVPAELRLTGLTVSENTIDLLESFGQALADLRLTARDLQPLIEALEGDTTTLLDIKEQLPANDPLAQLIDRVATISVIEAEKYRRGDYH